MKDVKNRIAAIAIGLAASLCATAASAQGCDAAALACRAALSASPAGDASFLDLVRAGDGARMDDAATSQALALPAVYVPPVAQSPAASAMAPAGVGALDSAMGTELSGDRTPAWLAIPKSLAAPDSSVAWIFGAGFLGFVILRRVRAAESY